MSSKAVRYYGSLLGAAQAICDVCDGLVPPDPIIEWTDPSPGPFDNLDIPLSDRDVLICWREDDSPGLCYQNDGLERIANLLVRIYVKKIIHATFFLSIFLNTL